MNRKLKDYTKGNARKETMMKQKESTSLRQFLVQRKTRSNNSYIPTIGITFTKESKLTFSTPFLSFTSSPPSLANTDAGESSSIVTTNAKSGVPGKMRFNFMVAGCNNFCIVADFVSVSVSVTSLVDFYFQFIVRPK